VIRRIQAIMEILSPEDLTLQETTEMLEVFVRIRGNR
jgi:hypothetical protein